MTNKLFIPQQLSWLDFNEAVLAKARDKNVPYLERCFFLGVFSSNLEEFLRTQYAELQNQITSELWDSKLQRDNRRTLRLVDTHISALRDQCEDTFLQLMREMYDDGLHVVRGDQSTCAPNKCWKFLEREFRENIKPYLFPIVLNEIKPKDICGQAMYLVTFLHHKKTNKTEYVLIKLPLDKISRFIEYDNNTVFLLEEVCRWYLPEVFKSLGYDDVLMGANIHTIQVIRDANLELDAPLRPPLQPYKSTLKNGLKQRRHGRIVTLFYSKGMPDAMLKELTSTLEISPRICVESIRHHNLKDFMKFPRSISEVQRHDDWEWMSQESYKIDVGLGDEETLLHFPYNNFSTITDLLWQAALDPDVREIYATLYRLAENSQIVDTLIAAAKNGKEVTCYVELEARFDEVANINYVKQLKSNGVKVIPKIREYKVHAKLILIRCRKKAHTAIISTGNWNEETAKQYSDICLITCEPRITNGVEGVFDLLETKRSDTSDFEDLIVSPLNTRDFFMDLLEKEIDIKRGGGHAWAIIKVNNLTDKRLAKKIIEAAQFGVEIVLVVRGMNIINEEAVTSNNIKFIRIIDRHLEHARIFAFGNGGYPRYFIGSADLMPRNLDDRIEVSVEIDESRHKAEIMQILALQTDCPHEAQVKTWKGLSDPNISIDNT